MRLTRIIPTTGSIVDEVDSILSEKTLESERVLVVFPGKRPAHFLRKRLALKKNAAFIPPAMFSYDEFIHHLAETALKATGPDLDPLDAASLLFEIHASSNEKLGGNHFTTFDRFLPLGMRLFDELEELLLAAPGRQSIAQYIGGLTFGNRHLLAAYFEEFYKRVNAQQAMTRSIRLTQVAEKIADLSFDAYDLIVLAGFYALTPTDLRIFRNLSEREQTVLVFQEGPGLQKQLASLAIDQASAQKGQMDLFGGVRTQESREPEIHFYKSSDMHGQVFALSALLKDLLDRKVPLDERTVIVLPSSSALFPVLYQSLALLPEEAYNVSLGYPLARTPLYGLLGSLLDLAATAHDGTVQARAYSRFVLHPYIKNIHFDKRTDVTRVLFHAIEEMLARRAAPLLNLDDLEKETTVFDRVARGLSRDEGTIAPTALRSHLKSIHDRTIRPMLNPGTLGSFAAKIIDLVLLVNNESSAYRHPLFSRYAEKLIESAEHMKGSGASHLSFDDITSYATLLRTAVGPQTVPFPGTPLRGLQVLGLLETRALSFDRVFILDASDDVLPGARGTEMIVPQGIREKLGLETYKDRERIIEYYFTNLIRSAREVHLLFAENNKQEKSRFIQKLLWERQQKNPQEPDNTSLARYRLHLANQDPPAIEKTPEVVHSLEKFEFSTTALDVYLKCQLRFYYRYVLGLKEKEEVGEEIEPMDVGNLVHRILRQFFASHVGKPLKADDISAEAIRQVTERTFGELFGPNQQGAIYLLKQQTVAKMMEFVEDYQKKILEKQTLEILGLEQEVSVISHDHHFSGRIDRVERRGDGKFYILDYKTRQDDTPHKVRWKKFRPEDRETWPEAIGSLQLPMYSLLYAVHTGEKVENIVPAYVFLGRNYLDTSIETGLSKDGIVTEQMHKNLHAVIHGLATEIKDQTIPFSATEDQKKECPRCPYQTMCGTQWAKEGRW